MKLEDACFLEGKVTNVDSILKIKDITLPTKVLDQSYGFSSSHVWMWELDHKEGWALKNWWFWTLVLEKTLESSLDSKEIKPVSPKGNQPWILIEKTDAEAEAPILWPPDTMSQFIGKASDAGKDWSKRRREQQRMRWLDSITDSMDISLSKLGRWWRIGKPGMLPWVPKSQTWLIN